ncbi:MAG TPA: alpha/beta hydrolase [Herbaspirillum sp.]|jgi:3-oxoadipate enol-lactonase
MSNPQFSEIPSGRLAYSRQGSGPVLVLLHPIGVDRHCWDEYVQHWRTSCDVLAIDFRGHGESTPVTAPISLSDHAADIAALLKKEGIESAHFIGVSMGGMVAQRIAIETPELVASLILCATAGVFPDEVRPRILARGDLQRSGSMTEVTEDTLARWFLADSPRPDLVQRCRERLLADDWYSWSANWQAISLLDNLDGLAKVEAPTLVVAGDADASIPPALSKRISDAMGLAEVNFVVIPGASHFGAYEMHDLFIPVFDKFLAA